jgi:universal stress protein A
MKKFRYKKILVPHDGSHFASSVLSHAVTLASLYNAEILLLRVVNSVEQEAIMLNPQNIGTNGGPYPDSGTTAIELVGVVNEYKKRARYQLGKLKTELQKNGISNIKTSLQEGNAKDVILEVAKKEKCDLIALSTRGRSGLGRALLGSVADYVIRHAPCPILVIHPSERSEEQI